MTSKAYTKKPGNLKFDIAIESKAKPQSQSSCDFEDLEKEIDPYEIRDAKTEKPEDAQKKSKVQRIMTCTHRSDSQHGGHEFEFRSLQLLLYNLLYRLPARKRSRLALLVC